MIRAWLYASVIKGISFPHQVRNAFSRHNLYLMGAQKTSATKAKMTTNVFCHESATFQGILKVEHQKRVSIPHIHTVFKTPDVHTSASLPVTYKP